MSEKILDDHKREKKKLIPPLNYRFNKLEPLSWVNNRLPELIWIAIIQEQIGDNEGYKLIRELNKQCTDIRKSHEKISFFGILSSFSVLTEKEKNEIKNKSKKAFQERLRKLLNSFMFYYPKCPLNFLFLEEELKHNEKDDNFLEFLKSIIESLFSRFSIKSTHLQASFVKLEMDSKKLFIQEDISVPEFSNIDKYPSTEESQKVAASIRATTSALIGQQLDEIGYEWSKYFWNRGLMIDGCYFKRKSQ